MSNPQLFQLDAAILLPVGLTRAICHRILFSVAYRLNTVAGHAIGYHVVANRVGAALAQGEVVLAGTPLIGMPFKTDAVIVAQ